MYLHDVLQRACLGLFLTNWCRVGVAAVRYQVKWRFRFLQAYQSQCKLGDEESVVNHSQMIAAVARRLRQFSRRDVREVYEALVEVWQEELVQPDGYIRIEGLGKLYVQQQTIRSTGVVRAQAAKQNKPAPALLTRYYFRFRPVKALHRRLVASREQATEPGKDTRHE